MTDRPLLVRLAVGSRVHSDSRIAFELDGQPCHGFEGDTVLTAVLALGARLRESEFGDGPRAGFCAMGACQDCWMDTAQGPRLRACSTPLEAGMKLLTRRPE